MANSRMKKVVIKGNDSKSSLLLEPKWIVEYYKRKGKEFFLYDLYERKVLSDGTRRIIYTICEDLEKCKNIYMCMYVDKFLGETISNLDDFDNHLVDIYSLFEDREDEVLIGIAEEINDTDIIKVIEIPSDVEYDVCANDCSFSEYIAEKHRVWS